MHIVVPCSYAGEKARVSSSRSLTEASFASVEKLWMERGWYFTSPVG
jgi:hypothetical protein